MKTTHPFVIPIIVIMRKLIFFDTNQNEYKIKE